MADSDTQISDVPLLSCLEVNFLSFFIYLFIKSAIATNGLVYALYKKFVLCQS
jgi:hypothetical protein